MTSFLPSWHFYKACWARTRANAKPTTSAQTLAHRQAEWSSDRPWVLPWCSGSGNWADRGIRKERGRERGRQVKVRHDSVPRAAFMFWHLMRRGRRHEEGETGQGARRGEERRGSQKVRVRVRRDMYPWQTLLAPPFCVSSTKCLICETYFKPVPLSTLSTS